MRPTPKATRGEQYLTDRARFLLACGSVGVQLTRAEYDAMSRAEVAVWVEQLDRIRRAQKG